MTLPLHQKCLQIFDLKKEEVWSWCPGDRIGMVFPFGSFMSYRNTTLGKEYGIKCDVMWNIFGNSWESI